MAKKKAPNHELVVGDCIEFMKTRWSEKPSTQKPKLIIADSPYNYGESYDTHDDKMASEEFTKWCRSWLYHLNSHATHPDGAIWLFWPDELVSFMDVYCQEHLGWYRRSWIVWYYTFGVCNSEGKNFSRSHTHLLYYTRKKTVFTFNGDAIMVPSARQLVYKDKRANSSGKAADNTWMLLKSEMEKVFTPDQDTWLENRVCGTYKERQKDSPNQIPLPIMERIILATSNPGDLVFDPFVGSGTSTLAAIKHSRRAIGVDISKKYIENAQNRIKEALPKI